MLPASYSPLLLQAQILIPPAGEMGLADTTRLENPFQGPMWLDEIRFSLPGNENLEQYGRSWDRIYCKLHLGGVPLTQGNIPISLFGKTLNNSTQGDYSAQRPYRFTWKLPKPLFIPARDLLRPTFYFAPVSGAVAEAVNICYACRPLPIGTRTPTTLQIPWVAAYVPPSVVTGAAASDRVDESQPSDLYNPWDQELNVQRFVGRLMVQEHESPSEFAAIASASANLQQYGPNSIDPATGTLVTAQDSFNNILIRDPTPFAHVFNFIDNSWTVNARLPPKGFYQFMIERWWSQYDGETSAFPATTGISMVGWRDVEYVRP